MTVRLEGDGHQTTTAEVARVLGPYQALAGEVGVTDRGYPRGDARRYGARGDGVHDDTDALNHALTSAAGGTCRIPFIAGGHYRITAPLTLPSNTTVILEGEIRQATTGLSVLQGTDVTELRIIGRGGALTGFSDVPNAANANAVIELARPTDCVIEGIHVTQAENYGILLTDAVRVVVRRAVLENIGFAGFMGLADAANNGCEHVDVIECAVRNVTATGLSSYGIAFGSASALVNMDHRYIRVLHCLVDGVPRWNGLDIHGGHDVLFAHNTVLNVRRGIEAILATTNSSTPHLSDVSILDNLFVAATADVGGQPEFGINVGGSFDGVTNWTGERFQVRRNTVRGFNKFFGSGVLGGVCFTNINDAALEDNILDDNAVNAIAGILQTAAAVVSNVSIRRNRCSKQAGTSGTFGVALYGAAAPNQYQNVHVEHNNIRDYDHGAFAESATQNSTFSYNDVAGCPVSGVDGTPSNFGALRENVGYATRTFGQTAAAASPLVVNHGLPFAPSKVLAVLAETGAPTSGPQITGVTATQFSISWGGGAVADWYWEAEI